MNLTVDQLEHASCVEVDAFGIELMFYLEAPVPEPLDGVLGEDLHDPLSDDRPGVDACVYEMDGDHRLLEAPWMLGQESHRELIAVGALVLAGVSRMDVYHSGQTRGAAAIKGLKQVSCNHPHVPRQDDELGLKGSEQLDDLLLVGSSCFELTVVGDQVRDLIPSCSLQGKDAWFVCQDGHGLCSDRPAAAPVQDRLEV